MLSNDVATAPFGDFNNAILGFLHARPLELLFGIPVVVLLVIAAIMLAAMLRQSAGPRRDTEIRRK